MRLVVSAAPPAAVLTMSRIFRRGQSGSCARAAGAARAPAIATARRQGILVAIMDGSFPVTDTTQCAILNPTHIPTNAPAPLSNIDEYDSIPSPQSSGIRPPT